MNRLIYLFPVAINLLLGGMFYITALRFSEAQAPGWVVGLTQTAWALIYSVLSLGVGRILTVRNAATILNIGCAMLTLSSLGFLFTGGLYTQFVWIVLAGIGSAGYCAPFQMLMKEVEPDQAQDGIVSAVGKYTCAWSLGLATGPLLFGLLPPQQVFAINTGVSFALWAGAFALSVSLKRKRAAAPGGQVPVPDNARPAGPLPAPGDSAFRSLAKLGWLIGGAGAFSMALIRVMWPRRGVELEIAPRDIGLALALLCYIQAGLGLAFAWSKSWMRKPLPTFLAGLSGTAGLALFAFAPGQAWCFYLASTLFGLYSSCFYFLLVYFALEDAEHAARNVGINEFIVGITGITSPIFGGLLAAPGAAGRAFYPEIVLTVAVTIYAAIVLRRAARS